MMTTISDLFVIFNPNSTGAGRDNAESLLAELKARGFEAPMELLATEYAGHAGELAYEIAGQYERPLIISSSGDGGYNELINGALRAQDQGRRPVCAVLASGNANDHRRTVRRRPLIDGIVGQHVESIDALRVTIKGKDGAEKTRHAHSYVGLGLTPTVAVELNRNRLNRMKETLIVIKTLRDFMPFEVDVDGKRLVLDSLVFANISQMAKVLTIADNAEPDDGRFKVIAFPYKNKAKLLFMLLKAVVSGINGVDAGHYEFTCVKELPIQFDGEVEHVKEGDTVSVTARRRVLSTIR